MRRTRAFALAVALIPPLLAGPPSARAADPVFARWSKVNTRAHKHADHAVVIVSLKPLGGVPGDMTSHQMRAVADLARRFGHGEIRAGLDQNLVLPHVARDDLPALHAALIPLGLATANAGLASDIVACPGMDYCTLATARSIPVAQALASALAPIEAETGPLAIRISGCINACGHHHLGDIGLLGLDKAGVENYQVTLGGSPGPEMAIGERAGPGLGPDAVVPGVVAMVRAFLGLRMPGETFAAAVGRLGPAPFIDALYAGDAE